MQRSRHLNSFVLFIVAMFALGDMRSTAHPFPVDQFSEGSPFFAYGIDAQTGNTVGQEFRPAFSALDVVEIGLGPRDVNNFHLRVNIRAGALDGPIVGTSLPAIVLAAPAVLPFFHFDFPLRVPLTPGNLYVIQPILDPPSGPVSFPFIDPPPFAGGRAIIHGTFRDDIDMLFRTGLTVPEPATGILSLLIATAIFTRTRCLR